MKSRFSNRSFSEQDVTVLSDRARPFEMPERAWSFEMSGRSPRSAGMHAKTHRRRPVARKQRFSKKAWAAAMACFATAAILLGGIAWVLAQPDQETGSFLIAQGDMTDEEAQSMLDAQAERSRITVSLRPVQELSDDGKLHVNFIVVPDNNGLSERLEIEQDGRTIYQSGVVEPEHVIEWGQADNARIGPATATVHAVGSDGRDTGNPVSVEIEITDQV